MTAISFKQFLTEKLDTERFNPDTAREIARRFPGLYLTHDFKLSSETFICDSMVLCLIQNYKGQKCLSVKFGYVKDDIRMCRLNLDTLIGAPDKVGGNLYAYGNHLTNLEGISPHVGNSIYLSNNPNLTSFKGISKLINHCKSISMPSSLTSHILGVLLIPGFEKLMVSSIARDISPELTTAMDIINKHLQGDKDILECQEELRTAGLREFGKL